MIVRLRSPIVMAQTLVSMDELTDGRMIMAPGACTNSHAKRHALPAADPPTALEEWIQSMRAVITGERVSFDGDIVKFPATSRTGLRIAGRIGDGVLLNAICSPEYSANALKIVREGAEEAGKNWDDFEVAQLINCSVEDDTEKAYDEIRWEVASKFDPIQMPFIAKPKMRVGEPYIQPDDVPMLQEAYERGGKDELMRALPERYIQGMTASGTPEEVTKKVQEFRNVGVRLPILRPAARHQSQRLLDLFAPN
jgi:alkanesulfonate monooxygenase SsuD/methylene tetrahydromethanopterin reductase-like flavin-dependent oxidoreductase (luciferase family)